MGNRGRPCKVCRHKDRSRKRAGPTTTFIALSHRPVCARSILHQRQVPRWACGEGHRHPELPSARAGSQKSSMRGAQRKRRWRAFLVVSTGIARSTRRETRSLPAGKAVPVRSDTSFTVTIGLDCTAAMRDEPLRRYRSIQVWRHPQPRYPRGRSWRERTRTRYKGSHRTSH